MIRLLLISGILGLFSCKNSQNPNLSDLLKSECFWDLTENKEVIGGLNSCYRFLPDGRCYYYYYNFYNRKRTDSVFRYDAGDVIVPDTWSVIGDTILMARSAQYRILSFGKEAVIVKGYMNDTIVLRKNCRTILEK